MNNGVILAATAAGLSTLPALAGLLAAPLKRKSFFAPNYVAYIVL